MGLIFLRFFHGGTSMKKCRITVVRMADYTDLQEKYENDIENGCILAMGQEFISDGWRKPFGMCDSAWETLSPFVMTLAHGGEDIYTGWMKNKKSAMVSCNDGFRPVTFYVEALEEDATDWQYEDEPTNQKAE